MVLQVRIPASGRSILTRNVLISSWILSINRPAWHIVLIIVISGNNMFLFYWKNSVGLLLFFHLFFKGSLLHHFRTLCHSWTFVNLIQRKILDIIEKSLEMSTNSLSFSSSSPLSSNQTLILIFDDISLLSLLPLYPIFSFEINLHFSFAQQSKHVIFICPN